MNKSKIKARKFVTPRILVLEGLYADTSDIVNDAGGYGVEASPWDFQSVTRMLKSGRIDGLLLTGGSDVNPARYGQVAHSRTQSPDNSRDFTELTALRWARENKKPVLGICRGSQIMCVSQGGTLTQDIPTFLNPMHSHGYGDHLVYVQEGSQTLPRACMGDQMEVTSLHHQCVDYPGRGMRIAARSIDGITEAIESKDGLMLGVQFHPEMAAYSNEQAFAIFRWLVETAAHRKGGKAHAVSFREAAERQYQNWASSYSAWAHDSDVSDDDGSWHKCSDGIWRHGISLDALEAELEADREAGKSASNPGGPPKREGKHRQAGDPAIPSMRTESPSTREMVNLIENSTGYPVILQDAHGNNIAPDGSIIGSCVDESELEDRLKTCPVCHIKFDLIEDCDDHKKYVHPQASGPLDEHPQRPLEYPPRPIPGQLQIGPVTGSEQAEVDRARAGLSDNDHAYDCDVALRQRIRERFDDWNIAERASQRFMERMAERYPEMEPPPGHPDWEGVSVDDVDAAERTERWLRMKIAVENGFDPEDWEDIDT